MVKHQRESRITPFSPVTVYIGKLELDWALYACVTAEAFAVRQPKSNDSRDDGSCKVPADSALEEICQDCRTMWWHRFRAECTVTWKMSPSGIQASPVNSSNSCSPLTLCFHQLLCISSSEGDTGKMEASFGKSNNIWMGAGECFSWWACVYPCSIHTQGLPSYLVTWAWFAVCAILYQVQILEVQSILDDTRANPPSRKSVPLGDAKKL